ncbi:MAG: hypothetical protein CME06_04520 [Gemmatimonadetes bacterium]|nr:hypothetical protein [Gemmatimonadota bacterium]
MAHPRVVLHIGLPKTGTTTLQTGLFARHDAWHFVGKPLLFTNAEMHRTIRPIVELDDEVYGAGLDSFRSDRIEALLRSPSDRIVISEEEFSTGTVRTRVDRNTIAQRLRDLFPDARIIVTVRNQLDVIPSVYGQLVNMGVLVGRSFGSWLDEERAKRGDSDRLHLFDYAALVQLYDRLFGAENVKVLLFEELRADLDAYLTRLSRFIGVDPAAVIATYRGGSGGNRNPRITMRHARWRRFTMAIPLIPWEVLLVGLRIRPSFYRFLEKGTALDTHFSEEQRRFLEEYYRVGNRALGERLGVELVELGYPV